MDTGRAARGGWEAAIDASLAARLFRPAVRPGISDPAHAPALAARLQRATAPTLADDLAHRYGTAALGGDRPPVVYAAPPAPPMPPAASSASSTELTTSAASGMEAVDTASATARSASAEAHTAPARPVVRAGERTEGPAFPPVRPLGAGPAVQRSLDLAGVALPVVAARRPDDAAAGAADGTSPVPRAAEAPVAARVVSPAPTRLQRQLAAEHAEATPSTTEAMPRVRAAKSSPRAAGDGERVGNPASVAPAGPVMRAGSAAGLVQRVAASGIADAADALRMQSAPGADGADAVPLAFAAAAAAPAGGARVTSLEEDLAAGRGPVTVARAGSAAGLVQRAATPGGEDRPVPRVFAVPAAARSDATPVSRPVVAAHSAGAAGRVQRAPLPGSRDAGPGGAATRLVHAAPVQAAAAAGRVQRQEATPSPPPGAPPAELPTATAPDARAAEGGDVGPIAERVYDILVKRLENERKQRGW